MTKVKSGRALWNSNAARLGGSEAVMHWTIIPFEISLDYTNLIDVNCFFYSQALNLIHAFKV